MIAIVHNLVGLLHAPMGVYYAYLDRAPVFLIGATGPMAEPKRRPFIDWIHTTNGQGEAIRNSSSGIINRQQSTAFPEHSRGLIR